MAFITKTDITKQILVDELNQITRGDDTIIDAAIDSAQSEATTYLFDSYDTQTIFAKTDTDRHQLLVNIVADIAIYIIVSREQAGQDIVDRENRYKRAIEWLKGAQTSGIYPDLERREDTAEVKTQIVSRNTIKRDNYV